MPMSKYKERNPSPQNDKRACMCKDGTYSRKCCNGSFQAQGIGNITKSAFHLKLEEGDFLLKEDNGKIIL